MFGFPYFKTELKYCILFSENDKYTVVRSDGLQYAVRSARVLHSDPTHVAQVECLEAMGGATQ